MTSPQHELAGFLRPTEFIDSASPAVVEFAESVCAAETTDDGKAMALFYAVRDGIRYDPYEVDLAPEAMRASAILARGFGFCIPKAVLLAAAARALGIASRLGFADVKNHLASERLRRVMESDIFVFHGYTEMFVAGKWVKATPAFNRSLCERFDVAPLEFDGKSDAMLQQFDSRGNRYLEYLHDRGIFADLPLEEIRAGFEKHHPAWYSQISA